MKRVILAVGLSIGALLAWGCGGEAAQGEECGEEGVQEGECEDGTVCGKPDDGGEALECLKVCEDQVDCPSTEECNGVSGSSVKACRPKDDATK